MMWTIHFPDTHETVSIRPGPADWLHSRNLIAPHNDRSTFVNHDGEADALHNITPEDVRQAEASYLQAHRVEL
jgi:hypothetical protein